MPIVVGITLTCVNTIETNPPMVRVAGKRLPLTLSTEEAAQWLNTSAVRLQQRRGTGVLPVEPLTLGHRLRWPTTAIAQVLGLPWEIVTNDAGVSQDDADVHVIAATSGTQPGAGTP